MVFGFDLSDVCMQFFIESWCNLQNYLCYFGQYLGGMVMCVGWFDEVVLFELVVMEDCVIVQWDKDDCVDFGIIKVDLFGFGMFNVFEEVVLLICEYEKFNFDLVYLLVDDFEIYVMLCRVDMVGVFQVESCVQMVLLLCNWLEKFYDFVIQVVIICFGFIVGKMMYFFFEWWLGCEEVIYLYLFFKLMF